jgi:hypothetical protein
MKDAPVIVIAGSRALPRGVAPRLLVRFLAAIPEGSKVLLRRGASRPPGEFEAQVEKMCDMLGLAVEWRLPVAVEKWNDDPEGLVLLVGREQTFARDMQMIYDADLVLCFHTPEQIGDETSGTASLVEKALQADKAVYAYAVEGETVLRVGEQDAKEEWSALVPLA